MGHATPSGKRVIGVDDQAENLAMLQTIVELRGHTFFGVTSGAECISLAVRMSPHLILLDIQMPDMDGFETCRRLRRIAELRHTPIAFLTGRKASADVRTGIEAGGNDFLVKPFDPMKLLSRIDHWTTRRIAA